ncbi:MAG: hypothetical protein K5644_05800 [Lachnospiraceae bacterium]|nr:hypothetical protein [Lachnospiraceae bacterium]
MSTINQVYELYDLMARRCRANKHSQHQAKMYAEIRDFIKDCSSVDESMVKIKNSKYYTAAAHALMLDKFDAYRQAARENKQQELEAIYDERYKEIEADYMKSFQTGYEKKVAAIEKKESNIISAFTSAYNAYIELLCTSMDKVKISQLQRDLKRAYDDITRVGETFEGVAANPFYRELIPANDTGFKEFIEQAPALMNERINTSSDEAEIQKEFDEEWKIISANKDKIISISEGEMSRAKLSAAVAVPPKDRRGKYTYELIEEEV